MMRGHEIFWQSLKGLGINEIFGNPGTTEIPMLRSVEKYYLTLHDSISLGMADALSQFSGKPALCNLHTVPGLGNSMAFLHTASQNHAPVIVTAGQQDYRHIFYDPILSGDLTGMVGGLVKYRYEIKDVADIHRSIRRAYQVALTPPMGPVFLSFPMNFMDNDYEERFEEFYPVNHESVNLSAVSEIMGMVNSASNPAIVFGYEIDLYHAFNEAQEFARRLGVPVYGEPLSSRGCYPSDDPQYAGDLPPASALIDMRLASNDLILVIGGDITLYPYTPSPLLQGKKVIIVSTEVTGRIGVAYSMNPRLFLHEASKLASRKGNFARKQDYTLRTAVALARKKMEPLYVMSKLKGEFSDHVIVDESVSASQILRNVVGYRPLSYFTAKTGQLGWALPAAAGIATAHDKVLAVIGDGSFMYTLQTLWTIRKYDLPVKVIILNNSGYMILRSFSQSYYADMRDRDFLRPEMDIPGLVEAFHIPVQVADAGLDSLKWLKEGSEPKVLVVNTSREVPKLFI